MKIKVIIDDRDHAIILASLRHTQNDPRALDACLSDNGLRGTNAIELDDLAERFNCDVEVVNEK